MQPCKQLTKTLGQNALSWTMLYSCVLLMLPRETEYCISGPHISDVWSGEPNNSDIFGLARLEIGRLNVLWQTFCYHKSIDLLLHSYSASSPTYICHATTEATVYVLYIHTYGVNEQMVLWLFRTMWVVCCTFSPRQHIQVRRLRAQREMI